VTTRYHRPLAAVLLAILLFLLSLLHGVFASGFIPILRDHVAEHAALAFGLYFAGLVLGQLLIVWSARLRRGRLAYPLYEAAFGATLVAIGLTFHHLPASLLAGRAVEGLFAGLAVPLLFQCVASMPSLGSAERRIALFNSLFALGFVIGPPAVAWGVRPLGAPLLLEGFGLAVILAALALAPLAPPPPREDGAAPPPPAGGWMDTFYLLFLGKTAYGFILPFVTKVLADRLPFSVATILLLMSAVFIAGQAAGGVLLRRFPGVRWHVVLPIALAPALAAMAVPALAWMIFVGGFFHSILMLRALLAFTHTPANARQFALLSSLSDPGLVLGATLAVLDGWGLAAIAALCLVPVLRRHQALAQG
jgi:MFS family permease